MREAMHAWFKTLGQHDSAKSRSPKVTVYHIKRNTAKSLSPKVNVYHIKCSCYNTISATQFLPGKKKPSVLTEFYCNTYNYFSVAARVTEMSYFSGVHTILLH